MNSRIQIIPIYDWYFKQYNYQEVETTREFMVDLQTITQNLNPNSKNVEIWRLNFPPCFPIQNLVALLFVLMLCLAARKEILNGFTQPFGQIDLYCMIVRISIQGFLQFGVQDLILYIKARLCVPQTTNKRKLINTRFFTYQYSAIIELVWW